MRLRSYAYQRGWLRSFRPGTKVISVGNITMGGTGKTPLAIFIARKLQAGGRKVAVVSRGYKGTLEGQTAVVSDGENVLLNAAEAGDEPALIARSLPKTPVLIGSRRSAPVALAQQRFGAEVVVCDDAFSHLALQRDCDVVCVHGRDGLGNGRCTPAGPLREPAVALERAKVIALNVTAGENPATEKEIRRSGFSGPIVRFTYQHAGWRRFADESLVEPSQLPDHRAVAFAGTARARDVFSSFGESGLEVVEAVAFSDHHVYRPADLRQLAQLAAGKGICYLATTEKDAIKITFSVPEPVELLVAAVEVEGVDGSLENLVDILEDACWPDQPSFSIATEP